MCLGYIDRQLQVVWNNGRPTLLKNKHKKDTNEISFPHINFTYSLSTNMSTGSVSQNLLFFRLFRSPSLTLTLLGFNCIFDYTFMLSLFVCWFLKSLLV